MLKQENTFAKRKQLLQNQQIQLKKEIRDLKRHLEKTEAEKLDLQAKFRESNAMLDVSFAQHEAQQAEIFELKQQVQCS